MSLHQEYAYVWNQGPNSRARTHLATDTAIELGRLRRDPRDALCKPRRKFYALSHHCEQVPLDRLCPRCLEIARRMEAANLVCLCDEPDGGCEGCDDPHGHTCRACDEEWCQACWESPAHAEFCPPETREERAG